MALCTSGSRADIHYAGGPDLGEYPYTTPETAAFYITDAINAAESGDTVLVLPGLHWGPAGGLELRPGIALVGSGPSETFLFAGVRVADGVRVSGFAFIGAGLGAWQAGASGPVRWSVSDCVFDGSAIGCTSSPWGDELTVRRCVFKNLWRSTAISAFQYRVVVSDCRFDMAPGARAVAIGVSDSLLVSDCWFGGCATGAGCSEGVSVIKNSIFLGNEQAVAVGVADASVDNCTFFGNHCALWISDQCSRGPIVRDSIIWASTEASVLIARSDGFGVPEISFSDVEGRYPGRGNIDADPMFFLPSGDEPDLHLCAFSPCVDAGDPFSDYSNEPEPNGGRVNMGAYGNTWEATTSELVDRDGDNMRDDCEIKHFGSLDRDGSGDADGDGLADGQEYRHLSDPNNPDTDGDTLPDGEEVSLGTDPLLRDTDNDGTPDAREVQQGTNPLDWTDAFTVLDFYIEEGYLYITYPTNPGYEYSLYSSNWPNGPFGFTVGAYTGRYGVLTHTDVLRLGPYNRFFRIRAWDPGTGGP